MKFNVETDLLQTEKPSNQWLFKDTKNPDIIRALSIDVKIPLSEQDELVMKKLIDFVRFSQDPEVNVKNTPDHIRPAVGLAAPQIGANINMFYVRIEKEESHEEYAMINSKIIAKSEQIAYLDGGEGCLSVDEDKKGIVPRNYKIEVTGYDWLRKNNVVLNLRGYSAIVFQHEILHNQGILYYDLIDTNEPEKTNPTWIEI